MTTALIADALFKEHDTGRDHPERPERIDAVMRALSEGGPAASTVRLDTRVATEDECARAHSRRYVDLARREIDGGFTELSTGDTAVCPRTYDVALRAAGSAIRATDAVINGDSTNAFCAVRPPGHHATRDGGMGFCVFNNVAVAARHAQSRHGIGNVLIVDWDVHHGNGTQDIFYDDATVFYFSTHQFPWYPGTGSPSERGRDAGAGTTMNCPVPAGAGRTEVYGAFRERLLPAMETFKPDMVFISAGFDSRIHDPLGMLTLTDEDFMDLTDLVLDIARRFSDDRVVSVLEGGYNLDGLAAATVAHVSRLAGG